MKHKETVIDKVLKIAAGILKNTILPLADKAFTPVCPNCTANLKNIWANYEEKKGRPMIYPYTFTAKLVQYPYQWHFKNGWVLKYWMIGAVFSIPLFHKISKKANSRENKKRWKEIRREWYGPSHH